MSRTWKKTWSSVDVQIGRDNDWPGQRQTVRQVKKINSRLRRNAVKQELNKKRLEGFQD